MSARFVLLSLLSISLIAPLAAAAPAPEGCDVATTRAWTPGAGVYSGATFIGATLPVPSVTADTYVESNGIDGLQRDETVCADGSVIPADTCITRYGEMVTSCAVKAL